MQCLACMFLLLKICFSWLTLDPVEDGRPAEDGKHSISVVVDSTYGLSGKYGSKISKYEQNAPLLEAGIFVSDGSGFLLFLLEHVMLILLPQHDQNSASGRGLFSATKKCFWWNSFTWPWLSLWFSVRACRQLECACHAYRIEHPNSNTVPNCAHIPFLSDWQYLLQTINSTDGGKLAQKTKQSPESSMCASRNQFLQKMLMARICQSTRRTMWFSSLMLQTSPGQGRGIFQSCCWHSSWISSLWVWLPRSKSSRDPLPD